ncbi:MAG: hypothetical protein V4513_06560 [Pseudomonadota bacterium]
MNHEPDGPVVVFRDSGADEPPCPPPAIDQQWIDHWRNRERVERGAAKRASSERARRVHQELAQAYLRIVERAEQSMRRNDGFDGSGAEPGR